MKTINKNIFLLALLVIIANLLSGENITEKITWDSIGTNVAIIGKLGVPLGEIVEIEGVVIDGNITRLKQYSSEKLLKVSKVNGINLDTTKILEYLVIKADIKTPQINFKFQIKGYESGGFTGEPRGVNRLLLPASTDFYFETRFIITEIISLKELTEPPH